MDIVLSRVLTLHHSNQVETRFTFLGDFWREDRFHRGRLREDRGQLPLADVLATIDRRQMLREEALRIDPKGAATLTPEDLLLKV